MWTPADTLASLIGGSRVFPLSRDPRSQVNRKITYDTASLDGGAAYDELPTLRAVQPSAHRPMVFLVACLAVLSLEWEHKASEDK